MLIALGPVVPEGIVIKTSAWWDFLIEIIFPH